MYHLVTTGGWTTDLPLQSTFKAHLCSTSTPASITSRYRPQHKYHTGIKMGGETISRPPASSYPKMAAGPVGKKIHSIYTRRLSQFMDNGQYYDDSIQRLVLLRSPRRAILISPLQ